MSGNSTAAASFPSTPYISDDYVFYEKSDVVLILSTRDTPLELDSIKYKATTTLIYSEYVVIRSPTLSLPGRNLGIFCSRLELKAGKANIDVSGKPGKTLCTTVTQGAGTDGADGENGGEIWIYVEEMTYELMRSLNITANGGDGDRGSSTTDTGSPGPPWTGGRGGNGGNGGKISIFYDSTAFSLLGMVRRLKVRPWPGQVLRAQRILVPGCEQLKKSGFPPDLLQKFTHTLSTYQTYAKSISALSSALRTLVARSNDTQKHQPQEQTIVAARDCLCAIEALLQSTDAPPKPVPADIVKLDTLVAEIGQWLGGGASPEEVASMCYVMESLGGSISTTSRRSSLSDCLGTVVENIKAIDYAMQNIIKSKTSSICGGKGGIGGYGAYASTIPGPRGIDGTDGKRISQRLAFDGRVNDLKTSQVYAFPDQCQMLLNKADRLFFNNNPEDRKSAATLYLRLTKRLSFVQNLLDTQKSASTSLLAQAYERVESSLHLTVSAMTQLESIYNHAQCRLNKICLGQDMFCSSPEWSPRLSYTFYKVRINNILASLRAVEDATSQFKDPLLQRRSTSHTVQVCIQANKETKAHTDNRIALLNNSKGILQTSATKVTAYTRIIAQKRAAIRSKIDAISHDTHRSLGTDPQSIIDAFSTLAIAPYESEVGTGMVDLAHKPWKTVQSSYGTAINTRYILTQLGSSAGTLQSLHDEYIAGQSAQIGAGGADPLVLMTTTSFAKQLVDSYKAATPEGDAEGLSQLLEDYISAVKIRNQAVIAFNATLQMLQEAMTDSKYYGNQDRYLSKSVTEVDPNLPSIYLWLKKIENDLRMDTMQLLEHGGRAIRFWSLHPPPDFNQPGPLRSYPDLSENQKVLERRFEDYLIDRASSAWDTWPVQEGRRGRTYRFSDEEILTLRKPYLEGNDKCHSVLLRFTPDTPPFIGMSNIRLRQVRVWLLGARPTPDVGYQYSPLAIEITHLGRESFQSEDGMVHKFDHDPVSIRFEYDTVDVNTIAHCNTGAVLCAGSLEQDETSLGGDIAAPIGPFGVWKINIKETENPGVDLGNLTAGFMEFLGRSTTFRDV